MTKLNDEDKYILAFDYIPEHGFTKADVEYLTMEDKAIAEKAVKKIIKEHGETLKRLGDL